VETGDFGAAERLLASATREAAGDKTKLASVWLKQGFIADALSRYANAERLFRKALNQAETKDHNLIAHRTTVLAKHYSLCEDFDQAHVYFNKALALRERSSKGPNAPEMAQLVRDAAAMFRDAGRLDAAEPLYRRAIRDLEKAAGKEYHLALAQMGLGELFLRQGKLQEAEALARQASETYDRQKSAVPFDRADCLATLAEALHRQKKTAEAEDAFRKSLALLAGVKVLNVKALPIVARAAAFYRENGRAAEATPLEEKAKDLAEKHKQAKAEASRDRQS